MEADVNDSSMKELNGVLSSIKVYGEHPPAMVKNITFYVGVTVIMVMVMN